MTSQPAPSPNVYRDGRFVVAPLQGAQFPNRCVVSGAQTHAATYPVRALVNTAVSSRMLEQIGIPISGFVFTLLLTFITGGAYWIYLLLTSRFAWFNVALHPNVEMARYRRRAGAILFMMFAAGIVIAGIYQKSLNDSVVTDEQLPPLISWVIIIGGILAGIAGTIALVLSFVPVLAVRDCDGRYAWLSGAHQDFLAALPPLPGAVRIR